jgi:hypothetical protein
MSIVIAAAKLKPALQIKGNTNCIGLIGLQRHLAKLPIDLRIGLCDGKVRAIDRVISV